MKKKFLFMFSLILGNLQVKKLRWSKEVLKKFGQNLK